MQDRGHEHLRLVNKLLEDDSRFVTPALMDRVAEGVKFEQLEQRGQFLQVDPSGRYGLLKEGVLETAAKAETLGSGEEEGETKNQKVVVVDAGEGERGAVDRPDVRCGEHQIGDQLVDGSQAISDFLLFF